MKNNQKHMEIAIGDVVLIKGDGKQWGKSNIGIVEELYQGKNNIIRAIKFRSKKTYIKLLIQFLYSLGLSWNTWKRQKTVHQCSKQQLYVNASQFKPWRNAAAIVEVRIQDAAEVNKDEVWSSLSDPFRQIGEE